MQGPHFQLHSKIILNPNHQQNFEISDLEEKSLKFTDTSDRKCKVLTTILNKNWNKGPMVYLSWNCI